MNLLATALLTLLLSAAEVVAADDAPCGADPACASEAGRDRLADGDARGAVDALKPAVKAHPESGPLARLLASAYLTMGNRHWAGRTLLAHFEADPSDMETRTWAAWLLMEDGDLERARALLTEDLPQPLSPAIEHRVGLLAAALHRLDGDEDEARRLLVSIGPGPLMPEDFHLYRDLRRSLTGDGGDSMSLRIDMGTGHASNALQGSPEDIADVEGLETGSPLVTLDSVWRFEPWTSQRLRPLGEARLKGLLPTSGPAADAGHGALGTRLGLELGPATGTRARLAWSWELLGVTGGDTWSVGAPRLYSEAHRAEVELDLGDQAQVFGGAGRRVFRDVARTRTEADGGAALVLSPHPRWSFTGILAGRFQDARVEAWDAVGATGLLRVVGPLPGGAMLRGVSTVVLDHFPRSAEWYGQGQPRQDRLLKLQVGPWSPPVGLARFGLSYTLSDRASTAAGYSYQDHRVLLECRLFHGWDPSAPAMASVPHDHQALPYGLQESRDLGLERIQDLLRQEDAARRGSTCID